MQSENFHKHEVVFTQYKRTLKAISLINVKLEQSANKINSEQHFSRGTLPLSAH